MSPIEHVWDMVGRHLVRHGTPVTSVTDLWARLQTAWRDIPQERNQNLFDSMLQRMAALIAAHGGHTTYWILGLSGHVQMSQVNHLLLVPNLWY